MMMLLLISVSQPFRACFVDSRLSRRRGPARKKAGVFDRETNLKLDSFNQFCLLLMTKSIIRSTSLKMIPRSRDLQTQA